MKIAKALKATLAAVVVAGSLAMAPAAHAGVFFSVAVAPPAIPVYEQPVAPGYGYIWTPGYWAYGPDGYYWVDGAWVYPPYDEALWTPGYWGWDADFYYWHPGYWGRTVGYYGGINYGFGYFGTGFYGGYWNGGHFFYNSAYNHIGFRDHDHDRFVYNQRVNGFDGRPGGAAFVRDNHIAGHGDFGRGAAVNGRDFGNRNGNAFAGRGNEQVNFRNGNARTEVNNAAAFNGNAGRQNFDAGRQVYNGNAGFAGRPSTPAPQSNFNVGSRGNFSAPQGGHFSAPQGNFGGGTHFSAPQGNAGGGGHANFGGGNAGGGFHGGGGGGGSHGGGGGRR